VKILVICLPIKTVHTSNGKGFMVIISGIWWRRGGTKPLLLGFHPDYPLNPLVLLVLGHQGTE